MNYRVEIEFSDEDGQDPLTNEDIVEALYHGRFPVLPEEFNGPCLIDIKDIQVHRY
jgi:hypothetical protein